MSGAPYATNCTTYTHSPTHLCYTHLASCYVPRKLLTFPHLYQAPDRHCQHLRNPQKALCSPIQHIQTHLLAMHTNPVTTPFPSVFMDRNAGMIAAIEMLCERLNRHGRLDIASPWILQTLHAVAIEDLSKWKPLCCSSEDAMGFLLDVSSPSQE